MRRQSMSTKRLFDLDVNGERHEVAMPPQATLLEALRYGLALTGSKQGCDKGDCGACTVLANGEPILACITLAADADAGRWRVTTIEGLASPRGLDAVQEAFDVCGALQCGFCQSGMMLSARALLDANPDPSLHDVKVALSGNLCRCTGYTKIYEAVQVAAGQRQPADTAPVRKVRLPTDRSRGGGG